MITPLHNIIQQLNTIIVGKETVIKQLLACILANGHVLLEDVPGVGKTTLAHSVASTLGLSYRRVQFTNDMLPADLLGVNIFQPADGKFTFHPGPIFHTFLLADEINRASPKLQSALLEAMEERQVSIDGKTYALPKPFLVLATQNPNEQLGTFPLPESQLDRFMMRLSLGYPSEMAEKQLYAQGDKRVQLKQLTPIIDTKTLLQWQQQTVRVHISDAAVNYTYRLIQETRVPSRFIVGLSPRAGLAILSAAKAWALMAQRQYVLPEDIQAVWIPVTAHRLHPMQTQTSSSQLLTEIINHVAIN